MSLLAKLPKSQAKTVMGIDASTNSIAFTVFWNRKPIRWGKMKLSGDTIYDRILDARYKVSALYDQYPVEYVAVEGAIMVQNPQVAIKLAMVFSSILSELQHKGAKVVEVTPLTWQSHIGNGRFTKAEKDQLKLEVPGKTESWYKGEIRKRRKQRTLDYFNGKWNMNLKDDDVGDSAGISYYAYLVLTKRSG